MATLVRLFAKDNTCKLCTSDLKIYSFNGFINYICYSTFKIEH